MIFNINSKYSDIINDEDLKFFSSFNLPPILYRPFNYADFELDGGFYLINGKIKKFNLLNLNIRTRMIKINKRKYGKIKTVYGNYNR